jgi:NADPH-dependent curcumin reductase CurA
LEQGSALVQLCKAANCKVIGVVGSTQKVDILKQLGADYIIDKSKQNLWKEVEKIAPEGVHACFDANGVETCLFIYFSFFRFVFYLLMKKV